MDSEKLPRIIAVGIYDAAYHIKKKESDKRKTHIFEIELPIENGGISYVDDISESISKERLICAKPGQIRHTRPPFKCRYVHLLAESGTAHEILESAPTFIDVLGKERYSEIFAEMCRYCDTGVKHDEMKMQSLLFELIYLIGCEKRRTLYGKCRTNIESDSTVRRAIEYIDNNYTEVKDLAEIAAHVHLSPVYFHEKFKSATGMTPHDYVLDKKIKKAANLILTTDLSLSRIAYECGFSSQSYFSVLFKKRMRLTPREYMRSVYNKYF